MQKKEKKNVKKQENIVTKNQKINCKMLGKKAKKKRKTEPKQTNKDKVKLKIIIKKTLQKKIINS